ncbi:MAG: DUF167 domain-containing protein [Planctomycetota bacterium]
MSGGAGDRRDEAGGSFVSGDGADVLVRVKAVPGAARDGLAGVLGDRLKVRVALPPEGGQANRALCRVIAEAMGVGPDAVEVERGHGSPRKVVRVRGVTVDRARAALPG